MQNKRITWLCAAIGGWIGGYVPALWGAGYFSVASIFFSTVGAVVGIWIAYKLMY